MNRKDLENVGAVCGECAIEHGFVQRDKAVGVWIGECGICHKRKPCTALWHDWKLKEAEK